MKMTNVEMDAHIAELRLFLDRRDRIGYAAARNTRILQNACMEYMNRKDELISIYGEPELDENGNPTGRKYIVIGDKAFDKYSQDIEAYASIEHDVDGIFKLKYDDVIDILSGEEILTLDWMLED